MRFLKPRRVLKKSINNRTLSITNRHDKNLAEYKVVEKHNLSLIMFLMLTLMTLLYTASPLNYNSFHRSSATCSYILLYTDDMTQLLTLDNKFNSLPHNLPSFTEILS